MILRALLILLLTNSQLSFMTAEDSTQYFSVLETENNSNTNEPEEVQPSQNDIDQAQSSTDSPIITQRRIQDIHVVGNVHVPQEAILQRIPYFKGEIFTPNKAAELIKSVYTFNTLPYGIGYFKYVNLSARHIGNDKVDLYVYVQEKHPLEEVIITGDKHLNNKELKKKIDFTQVPVVDEEDVKKYINIIRKAYHEKNYHQVDVTGELKLHDEKATLYITIKEGRQAAVKRVFFKGNKTFTDKKLRAIIFTREDWLLSFLDKAGTYQPEAIESDKHTLEHFYQSNGFINAKVINADVQLDEATHQYFVTFEIDEGEIYCIKEVLAPGNHLYTQNELLGRIPVAPGQVYSKERIREAIETLRLLWGEHGYIYADIAPSVQPNDDTKTVDVTFYSELGPQVYLNRINILGNQKTRDRIIRRNITLCEGELLTTKKMDESKERVELLGYFCPRDGVNWRISRVDLNTVDLDLLVKEEKTGKIYAQLGFGGNPTDIQSPSDSFSIGAAITDTNLFGLGINFNLNGSYSREQKTFGLTIAEPWLFDRPIHAAFDAVYKRSDYEDFKFTKENIKENFGSGSLAFGFLSNYFNDTKFVLHIGIDDIRYHPDPTKPENLKDVLKEKDSLEFARIIMQRFTPGTFAWVSGFACQDFRNHPIHPSRGYQWAANGRVGIPGTSANVGFFKLDLDFSWYTPLIGERDLVFCFHTHAGYIHEFHNRLVPYRELYHIGGPASVRGFLFGEIGPSFKGTSIGGKKAFWLNAELIFPINTSFTMKGAVFYDGGAGWDTPFSYDISPRNLQQNNFSYRHAVGFGVRLLHPTPVKLDWGFKLDRKKGESATEAHLTMYHNF